MSLNQNTIATNTKRAMYGVLQKRLVDTIDLASHAKQAHWNVKGLNFIALHKVFDDIHTEIQGFADLIAERLVALGGQARGTSVVVAEASIMNEYPLKALNQAEHIAALSLSLKDYGHFIRASIAEAEDIGDPVTADMFTQISQFADKSLWLVEANV